MSKKKKASINRPEYSQAWLARYGQGLSREEIRLVQAYRGLDAQQQEGAVMLLSSLVVQRAEEQARREGGAR